MATIDHGINKIDPGEQVFQCELAGCSNRFKRKHGFSFAIAYATPGLAIDEEGKHTQYGGYMCDESGETGQHWACSHGHAIQLAHACIDEHITHTQNAHRWCQHSTLEP